MSRTFSIVCEDCKKHIWIAQGRGYPVLEALHIYSGDVKCMKDFTAFLQTHEKHRLKFIDDVPDDYIEVGA